MKLRKILSRIGVGLLVFIALVLVVRAVLNVTEGRALRQALAGLKAKGIPLTAGELAPACPDEDNGARLWKAYENIAVLPGVETEKRKPGAPHARSAVAAFRRAWTALTSGQPIAPDDKAEILALLLRNQKAFELLSEMGQEPCFLYRDPAQTLIEGLAPNPLKWIRTAQLLHIAAVFKAEAGDVRGAVDSTVLGVTYAPLMAREGSLIAFLVSMASTNLPLQFLGNMVRGRDVPEADLVRLMALQDPGPWRERLAAAVRGERILFVEAGGGVIGGSYDLIEGHSWLKEFGFWLIRPLVKRDIRKALPDYAFCEAQAALPYYRAREALKASEPGIGRRPWYAFLSKAFLSGNLEAAYMKVAKIEAIMLANRAGLACRLHKNRTGDYPQTLDELVPGLLNEVPIDPFTGNPLVYRREGEGFIVYSLGSNQKDDGGRSTYMITQLVMEKDDDWSWREDR